MAEAKTEDTFISKIEIGEGHTILAPMKLELDFDNKRTLVITGKNGSGKTTLLNAIYELFPKNTIVLGRLADSYTESNNNIAIEYKFIKSRYLVSLYSTKRSTKLNKVENVGSPNIQLDKDKKPAANQFLQYLVNRKTQQAYALADNNQQEAQEIADWFNKLSEFFSQVFETKVEFKFNRNDLTFTLEDADGASIDLNLLSDGYSAIISIITDLIIQMEAVKFGDYNQPGIVFIDEVETHLHVSLQRQILPMLQTFFPRIQFVVTTHSPFVLSSVKDAIIYDMEHQERIDQSEGLWNYSYEALIEGYFEVERYSNQLKQDIELYKNLNDKDKLTSEERKQLRQLKNNLSEVPTYKNPAILRELQALGLK